MNDTLQDLQRIALLIWVFLKHGSVPLLRAILKRPSVGNSYTFRLRQAFEELGLTYLKLGQFLATRYDILPEQVCRELSKLFESVAPMPFADVRAVVERELSGRLETFFPVFHEQSIGAASVGQVHEAWSDRGDHVAVKVQRPNLERLFRTDMRILRRVARVVDALRLLGRLSVTEIADEFTTWTLREMNFLTEGRTAERIRKSVLPFEKTPLIYWDLTTPKLLTMEFVEGKSLSQIAQLLDQNDSERLRQQMPDLDVSQALHNLAFASLHQLFGIGFFHGDPHPGNIFISDSSTVTFIDFGIFGSLNDYEREIVVGLTENIAVGNIDESFRYYAKELLPTEETDLGKFERETKQVLRVWYEVTSRANESAGESAQPRYLGRYIGEMIAVSRRNGLRMGRRYLLFWRAMNALDATMLRLSADFDLVSEMRRYFQAMRPGFIERVRQVAADPRQTATLVDLALDLPGQVALLLGNLVRNQYDLATQLGFDDTQLHNANRDAQLISGGVTLLSLALLITAPLPAPSYSILLLAIVILTAFLTVRVVRRGK